MTPEVISSASKLVMERTSGYLSARKSNTEEEEDEIEQSEPVQDSRGLRK